MNKAVIDTNVLLVANNKHDEASPECVIASTQRLQAMQKSGVTVIDDAFRILGEYQHKTQPNAPKGVGDVFLKWLLRSRANPQRVHQVPITETAEDEFEEFPDHELQQSFDPPDRKFVAVANAHPDKPPVLQAVDCKWLDWWPALEKQGVQIQFLCPDDACRYYRNKFPAKPVPDLPDAES